MSELSFEEKDLLRMLIEEDMREIKRLPQKWLSEEDKRIYARRLKIFADILQKLR